MFLNYDDTLEHLGSFYYLDAQAIAKSNQIRLWSWRPSLCAFKAPLMIPLLGQGWEENIRRESS